MRRRRGGTLLEVLIAAGIFLSLSLLLLAGWSQGTRAWRTVSERNEILGQAQRFLRLTEKELEASSASGVEIRTPTADALSYASTFGISDSQGFEVDSVSGALRWQKQVILYHDSASQAVLRRQLPVPAGNTAYLSPTPISAINLGSGPKPITFYLNSGEVATRQVTALSFSLEGRRAVVRLTLISDGGRLANFQSCTLLRN